MTAAWTMQTAIGAVTLIEVDGALVSVHFGIDVPNGVSVNQTPLLVQAFLELAAYLAGERKAFSVPLNPQGTPFQLRCWRALLTIPYGQTRSYQQQAAAVGNEKACRAVGMANNRNPLPIFIPCHRVVGKNGSLTGYAGGLCIKEHLLTLEQEPTKKEG